MLRYLESAAGPRAGLRDDRPGRTGPVVVRRLGLGRLGRRTDPRGRLPQRHGTICRSGAGIYNYDTAMANQINAQTYTQLNDYWATVAHEAAFLHHARVHQEFLQGQDALRRPHPGAPRQPHPAADRERRRAQPGRPRPQRSPDRQLGPPRRQRPGRRQADRRGPLRELDRAGDLDARPVAQRLQVARSLRGAPLRQRQEALRRHRHPDAQGGRRGRDLAQDPPGSPGVDQ